MKLCIRGFFLVTLISQIQCFRVSSFHTQSKNVFKKRQHLEQCGGREFVVLRNSNLICYASKAQEIFERQENELKFGSSQELVIPLPTDDIETVNEYLFGDVSRIVYASWDEEMVSRLGNNLFELQTKPIQFLNFNIQPSVTIEVECNIETGCISLTAQDMKIKGAEMFSDRVSIEVQGALEATQKARKLSSTTLQSCSLMGKITFVVRGRLPSAIGQLTPTNAIRQATSSVNGRLTEYITQKFRRSIMKDFTSWSRTRTRKQLTTQ